MGLIGIGLVVLVVLVGLAVVREIGVPSVSALTVLVDYRSSNSGVCPDSVV